jgi:hypothetical protein
MLPRKQRFKVWGALSVLGLWFFSCYTLVAYRLKSDDLELMEREVYEELQKKKEVERYLQRQRREEALNAKERIELVAGSGNDALSAARQDKRAGV